MAKARSNALVTLVNAFQKYLWIDPTVVIRPEATNLKNQKAVTALIDSHGFDWRVWLVASSGFFTDSYNLFAVNVILPSLSYIYWPDETSDVPDLKINALTLSGSVVGMVVFGILADTYGRRKLYGIELMVVIFGTLGTVQASSGSNNSMSVLGWLMFWRFFMGIGIGAEYPLSAVITAEFAPKHARARMMAAVFLMQALGQLAAALVGLVVLLSLGAKNNLQNLASTDPESKRCVDSIWRIVIGTGVGPALIAILFRVTIPESPRYTLDVDRDGQRALEDTKGYYRGHHSDDDDDDERIVEDRPKFFSFTDLHEYFITQGNWHFLAGTTACWFFLDVAYYGLGISNPRRIAQIWLSTAPTKTSLLLTWQNTDPTETIYDVLKSDGTQYIITVSIGSVIGSVVLIKLIDYVPRKALMMWTFISLAILFAVIGGSLFSVEYSNMHAVTITLYVLSQLAFNLGPNALTFLISAEIFQTRYRATCHGISSAGGKIGSIFVQVLISSYSTSEPKSMSSFLFGFCGCMILGSFCCWIWLPDVQEPRERGKASALRQSLESTNSGRHINGGHVNDTQLNMQGEHLTLANMTDDPMERRSMMSSYKIPN
ncbi:major facilitator superfamily domain-containing protein, partial [Talaromyces proteolyticus]